MFRLFAWHYVHILHVLGLSDGDNLGIDKLRKYIPAVAFIISIVIIINTIRNTDNDNESGSTKDEVSWKSPKTISDKKLINDHEIVVNYEQQSYVESPNSNESDVLSVDPKEQLTAEQSKEIAVWRDREAILNSKFYTWEKLKDLPANIELIALHINRLFGNSLTAAEAFTRAVELDSFGYRSKISVEKLSLLQEFEESIGTVLTLEQIEMVDNGVVI